MIDTVMLAPILKSVRILSEGELRTLMDRVFSSKISEPLLTEEGLNIYMAHLGDFLCDE